MYTLVILRHGQTIFNKQKRFCGWTDVDLTEAGREEAHTAGGLLKGHGFEFDVVHSNVLERCLDTATITLNAMGASDTPIETYWRLNERHYGDLQGYTHQEKEAEFSKEQVFKWRRSFDVPPPMLDWNDPRHPRFDPLYKDVPIDDLPSGESVKMTLARVQPYLDDVLYPAIRSNKRILLVASHNSIRALLKPVKQITEEELPALVVPTGKPYVFELNEDMVSINDYYLEAD